MRNSNFDITRILPIFLAVRPTLRYKLIKNIIIIMDAISLLKRSYSNLGDIRNKLEHFNLCRRSGLLPTGLALSFNLALGVNDPGLVTKIESILDEASSELMDTLILFCQAKEMEMEEEYTIRKADVNDIRGITIMKREVNLRKAESLL